MKKLMLLMIANTIEAKIYEVTGHEYLLIQKLEHPRSRLKSRELTSDKSGHYKTDYAAHGQFIPTSDPHKEEHCHFAHIIAEFLDKAQKKKCYQHIILCAEPRFYGLLNQSMTGRVKSVIVKTIKKDYIPLLASRLNKLIENLIHEPILKSQ